MTFRTRLTVAFLVVAALPLGILGIGLRRELTGRLEAEAARRVAAARTTIESRVREQAAGIGGRLELLATTLANDNRFRIAISDDIAEERRWLIDWAGGAMTLAGFAVLQLQDSTGQVLSSGQFRNDFDRAALLVPDVERADAVVLDARTAGGVVRALVVRRDFTVRGDRYVLTGGVPFDSMRVAALSPDASVAVVLTTGATPGSADSSMSMPWMDDAADARGRASFQLRPDDAPVRAIGREITRWLLIALAGTLLLAVVMATMLARVVAAPIVELAGRTSRLDLDKLDQRFVSGRTDELGTLESTLDALAARLRTSVARLREAERAAATGDLARQVNHDVKNGLAPIRNVLRHLAQVGEKEPDRLNAIFAERRPTLEASVEYLEQLARNYARLSPASGHGRTDPRPVIRAVAHTITAASVDLQLPDELPQVRGDAVVLRRMLDNLVANAVDSLEGKPGTVTLGARVVGDGVERRVRFTVSDTGRGMTRQELDRAFDDFHTTKPAGTGLGLSVVRRLVGDVGGSVRAETAPGEGSIFMIDIPVAS